MLVKTEGQGGLERGFPSQMRDGRARPLPWTVLREHGRSGAIPHANQACDY